MVLPLPAAEGTPLLGGGGGGPRSPAALVAEKARARMTDVSQKERMADVIKELEGSAESANWWKLFALATVVNHFLGGTITMHLLEGWSFGDALYFCVVVTTTVGYGDMAPQTTLGKMYVCYYVLAAVCLVSSVLSFFVGTLIDRQEEALMAIVTGEDDDEGDVEGAAHTPPTASTPSPIGEWLRSIPVVRRFSQYRWLDNTDWLGDYSAVFYTAVVFLIVGIIGASIFMSFEGLSLLDAVYVTFISATTVGFGDIDPVQPITKTLMSVWLVVSTIVLAKLVGDQSEAHAKTRQRAASRRLLSARMTTRSLATMDADGDGKVDRCEFLTALLVQTGKAQQDDIDEILARFAQLDKDGSGAIARAELAIE